jgi:hypothetical protein
MWSDKTFCDNTCVYNYPFAVIVAVYSSLYDLLTKPKAKHTKKSSRHRTFIYPKEWLKSEQRPKKFYT